MSNNGRITASVHRRTMAAPACLFPAGCRYRTVRRFSPQGRLTKRALEFLAGFEQMLIDDQAQLGSPKGGVARKRIQLSVWKRWLGDPGCYFSANP